MSGSAEITGYKKEGELSQNCVSKSEKYIKHRNTQIKN